MFSGDSGKGVVVQDVYASTDAKVSDRENPLRLN